MKKMACFLLLFTFFYNYYASAQLRTAIVGGAQVSSVPGNSSTEWDTLNHTYASRTGFHAGLLVETQFFNSSKLYFRTGIVYINKGRKFSSSYDTTMGVKSVSGRQFVNYMELPLNIMFKTNPGGRSRFVAGAGPYVSFLFSGNEATQTELHNGSVQVVENTSLKLPRSQASYKNVNLGFNVFAGAEFGRLFFNANFSRGLGQFYSTSSGTGSFKHQAIGATLGVYLSSERKRESKMKDRDHDNVPDMLDECPREKGSVASKGCPDKDNDGIADKEDVCPNIAGLAKYKGCAAPDSDNDGVNDEEDKCSGEKGTKENNGCPENEESLRGTFENYAKRIQFRYKSADLTDQSKEVLDNVVKILKRNLSLNVLIEGYTSKDGRNHQKISEARAESVKTYLEENGIRSKRLKAVGFGASNPVNQQKTEVERAANRRVELKIVSTAARQ
jgi:OmpA-OmpF porin, OOP family